MLSNRSKFAWSCLSVMLEHSSHVSLLFQQILRTNPAQCSTDTQALWAVLTFKSWEHERERVLIMEQICSILLLSLTLFSYTHNLFREKQTAIIRSGTEVWKNSSFLTGDTPSYPAYTDFNGLDLVSSDAVWLLLWPLTTYTWFYSSLNLLSLLECVLRSGKCELDWV